MFSGGHLFINRARAPGFVKHTFLGVQQFTYPFLSIMRRNVVA